MDAIVGIGALLVVFVMLAWQINRVLIELGRDLGVKVRMAEKDKPKETAAKPARRKK